MAWTLLPTDYTDAVWSGLKKYNQIDNSDGTISLQDVTVYTNRERSFFGARDANRMNEAINYIMSALENGTNLYEEFQTYFTTQMTLFHNNANSEFSDFHDFLYSMETSGQESLTQIADRAAASESAAKASKIAAKSSENAAKVSENNAKSSETTAVSAKDQSVAAQGGAETAQENARTYMRRAETAAERAERTSVRIPRIGTNGNWYVWDSDVDNFVDSGVRAQGDVGPQGAQGIQGNPGPQGMNGVAVASEGIWAFNVNEEGHLILHYTGTEVPDAHINAEGHLIINI